jgi:ribosomal protein L27
MVIISGQTISQVRQATTQWHPSSPIGLTRDSMPLTLSMLVKCAAAQQK